MTFVVSMLVRSSPALDSFSLTVLYPKVRRSALQYRRQPHRSNSGFRETLG